MIHAVIVVPTYNEKENIASLISEILKQEKHINYAKLSILVVDDSSPDGTAEIVKELQRTTPALYLLSGKKEGLGKAYIRGFTYAMKKLHADVIFEMDADFSHNPRYLPVLLDEIFDGKDFVIGSRYIAGGSIPKDWSLLRKANSKFGNTLAKKLAGLSSLQDCTGGFRAIRTTLLKKIDLQKLNVKGYAFQISLLAEAKKKKAKITEVPIHFSDRKSGTSKIRLSDIIEFIWTAIKLRYPHVGYYSAFTLLCILGFFLGIFLFFNLNHLILPLHTLIISGMLLLALFMLLQSIFALYLMIYSFDDPEDGDDNSNLQESYPPRHSFTLLLPARHEENVIRHTLQAMANLNYPTSLYEVLVICRTDDTKTITAVKETIAEIKRSSFKLLTFSDQPINKPHGLNIGLSVAKKEIVAVFDAEDEPNREILQVMNRAFSTEEVDVVQGGVQLMNFATSWYSTFNVLEYFFWFKSTLRFFAKKGFVPLGGNTVFFKRKTLLHIKGWDEECLTEDAEIGVRLSAKQVSIKVIYDEQFTTQEETPHSIPSFIKQRTRWNQGFIQVLLKGSWLELPTTPQKLLALYVLSWPIVQSLFFLYIPVSIVMVFLMRLPVMITLLTLIPMYLLFLHFITQMIGLFEFSKQYKKKVSAWVVIRSALTFYFYQVLLGVSALRAVIRTIRNNFAWEKTIHLNTHRNLDPIISAYIPLNNT